MQCGAEGIRTPGLLDAIQALYQLSYGPGIREYSAGFYLAKVMLT